MTCPILLTLFPQRRWKAISFSVKEKLHLLVPEAFTTVFTSARCWFTFRARCIQSTPSSCVFWDALQFHFLNLCLGLPWGFICLALSAKDCMQFCYLPSFHTTRLLHLPSFGFPTKILRGIQNAKLALFSVLLPTILPSILYLNTLYLSTLSLFPIRHVGHLILNPYKTLGKMVDFVF